MKYRRLAGDFFPQGLKIKMRWGWEGHPEVWLAQLQDLN
jgi:hypothetical protein